MKTIKLIPEAFKSTSALFVALGDEQRQRILLAFEPNERLNILQIVAASTLSRTAVTHHLKILHQSGALNSEKIGKEVFFWINHQAIIDALQGVMEYVEQLQEQEKDEK
jgi:predicted transcriptional regulator